MYPTGTTLRRAVAVLGQAFQPYTNPASLLNTGSIPLAVTNDDDAALLIQFDGPSRSIPRSSFRRHNRGQSFPTPPVSPTDHRMRATAVRDPRTRPSKPARDEVRVEDIIRSFKDMSLSEKRDTSTIAKAPVPAAQPTLDPRVRHPKKSVGPTDDAFLKSLKSIPLPEVPRGSTRPTSLVAPIPVKASVTPTFLLHPRVRELRTAPTASHTVYKKPSSSTKERVITGPKNITPTSPVHVPTHRTKRPGKGILRNSNPGSSARSDQTLDSRPPVPPAPAPHSQASSSAAAHTCGADPDDADAGTGATADVPKVKRLEEQVFGGDSGLEDKAEASSAASIDKGKGKAVYPAEEPAVEASGRLEEGNRNDAKEERPETFSTLDASASESSLASASALTTAESTVPQPDATQPPPTHMSAPTPLSSPPLASVRPSSAVFEPLYEPMDIYHESVVELSYGPMDVCDDSEAEPLYGSTDVCDDSEVEPLYGPMDIFDESEVEPCYGPMDVCNESFTAPAFHSIYLHLLRTTVASLLGSSEDELQWGYMDVE